MANEPIKVTYVERPLMDKDNPYLMLNVAVTEEAFSNLSGNGFKLWFYLAKNNKDLKSWVLYRSVFTKVAGVSPNTFGKARDELIEKGYLIDVYGDKKCLEFREVPLEKTDKALELYGF